MGGALKSKQTKTKQQTKKTKAKPYNPELPYNPVIPLLGTYPEKNIIQSMSRKGNSLDNGLMESFFGIMKSEMFYREENNYKNIEDLKLAIEEYIDYYNNKRIKVKLKGLSPAEYRNQSLLINN